MIEALASLAKTTQAEIWIAIFIVLGLVAVVAGLAVAVTRSKDGRGPRR